MLRYGRFLLRFHSDSCRLVTNFVVAQIEVSRVVQPEVVERLQELAARQPRMT